MKKRHTFILSLALAAVGFVPSQQLLAWPQPAQQPPGAPRQVSSALPHQTKEEVAIRQLMAAQAAAWNRGSLDDFMKGYWKSDKLEFIGKSGISYGYENALNNYKKSYDSPDKMGQLFFTLLKVDKLSPDYCFVVGKWLLKRKIGDVGGIYTLLFRKINGEWVIVVDHTS